MGLPFSSFISASAPIEGRFLVHLSVFMSCPLALLALSLMLDPLIIDRPSPDVNEKPLIDPALSVPPPPIVGVSDLLPIVPGVGDMAPDSLRFASGLPSTLKMLSRGTVEGVERPLLLPVELALPFSRPLTFLTGV